MTYTIAKVWDAFYKCWWTAPSGKDLWVSPKNAQIAVSSWVRDKTRRSQLLVVTELVEFKAPHPGG